MKKNLLLVILVVAIVAVAALGFTACSKKTPIGVQQGTTGEYYVKGDVDWEFEGFKNLKASPYSNAALAVQAMKSGSVNAVIIDEAPAKALAKKIEGIKVIDIALTEEQYGFGVDKAQTQLLADINAIMATPEFAAKKAEIMNTYFVENSYHTIEAKTTQGSDPSKELVVATNAEFAPFEYKEGDKFAGIDMEIAAYLAEKLGLELVVKDMEFDSVVTSIGVNDVDIAMSGLTINDKRKESVNFTTPYYDASQMLVVLSTDTTFDACKTAADVEAILKTL